MGAMDTLETIIQRNIAYNRKLRNKLKQKQEDDEGEELYGHHAVHSKQNSFIPTGSIRRKASKRIIKGGGGRAKSDNLLDVELDDIPQNRHDEESSDSDSDGGGKTSVFDMMGRKEDNVEEGKEGVSSIDVEKDDVEKSEKGNEDVQIVVGGDDDEVEDITESKENDEGKLNISKKKRQKSLMDLEENFNDLDDMSSDEEKEGDGTVAYRNVDDLEDKSEEKEEGFGEDGMFTPPTIAELLHNDELVASEDRIKKLENEYNSLSIETPVTGVDNDLTESIFDLSLGTIDGKGDDNDDNDDSSDTDDSSDDEGGGKDGKKEDEIGNRKMNENDEARFSKINFDEMKVDLDELDELDDLSDKLYIMQNESDDDGEKEKKKKKISTRKSWKNSFKENLDTPSMKKEAKTLSEMFDDDNNDDEKEDDSSDDDDLPIRKDDDSGSDTDDNNGSDSENEDGERKRDFVPESMDLDLDLDSTLGKIVDLNF